MKPKVPAAILDTLRSSGQPPPWTCKLHLSRGRTVYAVEVTNEGEIAKVGGRAIYSASDISFGPANIQGVSV